MVMMYKLNIIHYILEITNIDGLTDSIVSESIKIKKYNQNLFSKTTFFKALFS